jgi:hypothetical protein
MLAEKSSTWFQAAATRLVGSPHTPLEKDIPGE